MNKICGMVTEVYSRVVGYFRPVDAWNKGKKEEFKLRKNFNLSKFEHTFDTPKEEENDNKDNDPR